MTSRKLIARIKSATLLCDGFLKLSRYQIEAEKHEGGTHELTWFLMERGNGVGVLGFDPVRDEVVLVNELRPGALIAGDYPYADNIVAGGVDDGESPIDAAVREMKEEANLDLRDPILVHPGAFVSSGDTSEKMAIVVGFVDTSNAGGVHGNHEEREDIKTVVLPALEFIARVRGAEITDLKTLVAGYWLADNHERLRRKEALLALAG